LVPGGRQLDCVVGGPERDPRVQRPRALDEQLGRRRAREGRHRELVLAFDPECRAARDQQLGSRRAGQQAAQLRRGVQKLLEDVDHQQPLDRRERRQRHEHRPVRELRREPVRELEREPRLADPARSGQRHEPHPRLRQQCRRSLQVRFPPERRRRRMRQRRSLKRR
jgi:hypothetical protein